jgi:hypothetical protein
LKTSFREFALDALLTAKQNAQWIVAFVIICFLAVLCGSYLLGNHVGLLIIMVLGVVCILIGGVAYTLFNGNKIDTTSPAPITKSAPRITSAWEYRVTKATRRSTAIDDAAPETAEVLGSSAKNENDYVWFNALECSANTLVDPSPDVLRAEDECASAANPDIVYTEDTVDDATVTTYDQSPIDNHAAIIE